MKCGIYIICNKLDGKMYIGQSIDLKTRIKNHLIYLRKGKHSNGHLQMAFLKYGEGQFNFSIAEESAQNKLDELERKYISFFKTTDNNYGYNYEYGGDKNKTRTEESRKRTSDSLRGHPVSKTTRLKLSLINTGKKLSAAHRLKMSFAVRGRKHSELAKKRMSIAQTIACKTRKLNPRNALGQWQGPITPKEDK